MTRINIVPPTELTDQHLMAEYRELAMVPSALHRSLKTKRPFQILKEIPKEYTLNTGHVKFFYDKMGYLQYRFLQLVDELKRRNFSLDEERIERVLTQLHSVHPIFWNMWTPTEKDYNVIRQRIQQRINEKPNWYRKTVV